MWNNKVYIISMLSMVLTFFIIQNMDSAKNVIVFKENINLIPPVISEYNSIEVSMEKSVIKELNTDSMIFRQYYNKNFNITLYIGYYGTAKGGRTGHNPNACYPGSGWAIVEDKTFDIDLVFDGKPKTITVNRMLVNKKQSSLLVYHWYQSRGSYVLSSGIEKNINRFKNKILYNRNDGAFIRVTTEIQREGFSNEDIEEKLKSFVQLIYPIVVQHWPVEKSL